MAVAAAAAFNELKGLISELNLDIISERVIYFQNKHWLAICVKIRITARLAGGGVIAAGIL